MPKCVTAPFPRDFLRGAGHSLYEQIENLRVDFIGWLMGIMVMPALFMLVPLSQGCFSGKEISISVWLMVAAEEDRRCAGVQRQGVEKGDRRLPRAQVVRRTDPADPAPEG